MFKIAKITLWTSTIIWSIIMLTSSYLITTGYQISAHFNFEIWIEFTKAILLWYIIAISCALGIDYAAKI